MLEDHASMIRSGKEKSEEEVEGRRYWGSMGEQHKGSSRRLEQRIKNEFLLD